MTPLISQRRAAELSTPSGEDRRRWLQVATSPFVMSVMLRWLKGISFPFHLGIFPRKSRLLHTNKSGSETTSLHLATFRHDTESEEQLPGRAAWFTAAAINNKEFCGGDEQLYRFTATKGTNPFSLP